MSSRNNNPSDKDLLKRNSWTSWVRSKGWNITQVHRKKKQQVPAATTSSNDSERPTNNQNNADDNPMTKMEKIANQQNHQQRRQQQQQNGANAKNDPVPSMVIDLVDSDMEGEASLESNKEEPKSSKPSSSSSTVAMTTAPSPSETPTELHLSPPPLQSQQNNATATSRPIEPQQQQTQKRDDITTALREDIPTESQLPPPLQSQNNAMASQPIVSQLPQGVEMATTTTTTTTTTQFTGDRESSQPLPRLSTRSLSPKKRKGVKRQRINQIQEYKNADEDESDDDHQIEIDLETALDQAKGLSDNHSNRPNIQWDSQTHVQNNHHQHHIFHGTSRILSTSNSSAHQAVASARMAGQKHPRKPPPPAAAAAATSAHQTSQQATLSALASPLRRSDAPAKKRSTRSTKSIIKAATSAATLSATTDDPPASTSSESNSQKSQSDAQQVAPKAARLISPDIRTLTNHCWKCAEPLCASITKTTAAFNHGETATNQANVVHSCYTMHLHPLLQVPVCVVCAEELVALEQDRLIAENPKDTSDENKIDDDEMDDEDRRSLLDKCVGCCAAADSDDDVDDGLRVLCDKCDRAFCKICIAKAHGGGSAGARKFNSVLETDPWECPVCCAPEPLQELAERTKQFVQQRDQRRRSVEEIVSDLEFAEEQKRLAIEQLDHEQEKTLELRQEVEKLHRSQANQNNIQKEYEDLEDEVQDAVTIWRQLWINHEVRVSETIGNLLDELSNEHKITPAVCYQEFLGQQVIRKRRNESDSNDSDQMSSSTTEEEWIRIAEKEIEKREMQRAREKVPHIPTKMEETFEDIEDLGTDIRSENGSKDEDNAEEVRSGWRFATQRPSKAEYEKALLHEKELNVHVKQVVQENADAQAEKIPFVEIVVRTKRKCARKYDHADNQALQPSDCASTRRQKKRHLAPRNSQSPSSSSSSSPSGDNEKEEKLRLVNDKVKMGLAETVSQPRRLFKNDFPTKGGLALCSTETDVDGSRPVRTVTVASFLVDHLKQHQIDGIRFLWKNCFFDFAHSQNGDPSQIGGAVLAHHMGLGKSLQTIALIYTLMTDPSMENDQHVALVRTILFVVPVNTVLLWEAEFEKWLGHKVEGLNICNLCTIDKYSRSKKIAQCAARGGILLVSDALFRTLILVDGDLTNQFQPVRVEYCVKFRN
jgi:hypothetical protein